MAFKDRQKTSRIPYAGIIRLGVMVKSCAIGLVHEKILVDDNVSGSRIEFVKIKGDPKPDREWEVIRHAKNQKNLFIRVPKDSPENLSFIKKDDDGQGKLVDRRPSPTAVEWFVVDHLPNVVSVYGRRPTELEIMCPSNEIESVIPGKYKNTRGDLVNCVGDGETARRMDSNGAWHVLPYCNCGYKKGLPSKVVSDNDLEVKSGNFAIVRTEDKDEKDVWRKIASAKENKIILEELVPTCGPKVELRILLYKTDGTVLTPYVIRTKNLKTYDYIENTLDMIKNGNEQSRGIGRLMNIPLLLKIRIEKSHIIEEGKKIPKDDVVLMVDFDTNYGNPLRQALPDEIKEHSEPKAIEDRHVEITPKKQELDKSKEVKADFESSSEGKNSDKTEPSTFL